jgi:PAS domain S-box-containing protein
MSDLGPAAKLRAAFELSPTILAVSDLADGRMLEVNDAFLRATGYTREEIIGQRIADLDLWVNPAQRAEGLAGLRAGRPVRDLEARFRTKHGTEIVTIANADLVVVDGRTCVLTALMDITDRVRAEAALRESEQRFAQLARAKDEFLAMLGHELRNPLGTITNTLGVLTRLIDDARLAHLTEIIGRQSAHLTRLVDDLLDVARVTSGKIELRSELVDLHGLAERCLEALTQAGRTAEHRVALTGAPVRVHGDPARLEQVITNLVDNALKYTPAGGSVDVSTERVGSDAILRVRDTGEGIRADMLDRVFELFVQEPQALDRSRGGLGLGLTLVKWLAKLHQGDITVASAGPGLGSEFTLHLPLAAEERVRDEGTAPAPGATPARRRRVLIVEDNADARESLQLLLEMAGHEVETSEDAPSALQKLEAFWPDVALIDVGLPGIDGYSLARTVRRDPRARDLCLVAITGYGQAEDRRQALASGFDVHVTKPVDPDRLEHLLRERA